MICCKCILVLAVSLVCCSVSLAKKGDEVFRWKRVFNNTEVKEKAVINAKKKTMLMNSLDPALEDSGLFKRSQSFHDFKKGKVAVKVFPDDNSEWCFVMDIDRPLNDVVKEAKIRQANGVVRVDENTVNHPRVTCERMDNSAIKQASKNFKKFCKKAAGNVYRVIPYNPLVDKQFNVIRYPWPIWCFWWPYPIYLTINIEINIG